MQFSEEAASSPMDGVTGDHETAVTGYNLDAESSKTWRRMGPISISCWERGEGNWEMTRREDAP